MTSSCELPRLLTKPCGPLRYVIVTLDFLYDLEIFITLICCGFLVWEYEIPEDQYLRARFPDSVKCWKSIDCRGNSFSVAPWKSSPCCLALCRVCRVITSQQCPSFRVQRISYHSGGEKKKSTLCSYTNFSLKIKKDFVGCMKNTVKNMQ